VYILTVIRRQDDPIPFRRRVLGRLPGSCIERIREVGGRPREQSVHLARMEVMRGQWRPVLTIAYAHLQ